MKDGFQLIARLPYPMTQPKRLAVASEVATTDLVRSHGLPVPQVYGYSTDADNPVGAEYILMEKSRGKVLGDVWFMLSHKDRIKVLSGIAKHEAKLFDLDLPASGSVYFEEDLLPGMGKGAVSGRVVGKAPVCRSGRIAEVLVRDEKCSRHRKRPLYDTHLDPYTFML